MNKLFLTATLGSSLALASLSYDALAQTPAPATAQAPAQAPGAAQHPNQGFMGNALSKLQPANAAMVRDTMQKSHEKDKPLMDKAQALHKERQTIISADKFDEKAFLANGASIRQLDDQMRTSDEQAFAGVLAKLPASERKILAENMNHPTGGYPRNNKGAPKAAPAKP